MRLRLPDRLRTRTAAVNAGLAVLLVGGGAWSVLSVRSDGATASGAAATRTATVGRTTVTQTVTASGSIASSQVQGATFATTGTVTHIYVKVGESVAKGATLAAIDPTTAKQQLRAAEDTLAVAKDTLAQASDADDTSAIDSAQTQVTAAESGVADAEAALAGTVLTAPIAGTVIESNGTVSGSSDVSGSTSTNASSANSANGFIVIANLKAMELDVNAAEADAAKLKTGQAATADWTALTGATATGSVASIDATGSTSSGVVTYPVVVTLANLPAGVRIGQSAAVTITTGTRSNVLAVPNAAVRLDGSAHYVTMTSAAGAGARRVAVTIGLVGDSLTEVTGGLVEGQTVTVPTTTSSTTPSSTGPGANDAGAAPGGQGGPPVGSGAGGP
jgi:membrane fusion protein, macrolide-specific efflux system